jgi:TPR repeat protein
MVFIKSLYRNEEGKLRKAAESGDVNAMNTLGFKYEYGKFNGTPKYQLAYKWYKAASDQGDGMGLNNLGRCYERGCGVKVDINKAIEIYEQAYAKGNVAAASSLSAIYIEGRAGEIDEEKAMPYIMFRAEHGEPDCLYDLSFKVDINKAIEIYEQAYAKGNAAAASCLSAIYMKGRDGEIDEEKAMPYIMFGAEHGEPYCLYNLSLFYLDGRHVEKDVDKANQLMYAAAKAGSEYASWMVSHYCDLHNLRSDIIDVFNTEELNWLALQDAIDLGKLGIAEGYFLFAQMIMLFIRDRKFIITNDKNGKKIQIVLPEGEPRDDIMDELNTLDLPYEINDGDLNNLVVNYVKKAANMGHKGAQDWLEQNKESI